MNKTVLAIVGVVVAVLVAWGVVALRAPKPSVSTSQNFAGVTPSPVVPAVGEENPPARQSEPLSFTKGEEIPPASGVLPLEKGEKGGTGERGETAAVTVTYTDAGFSPATVTIANGGTVTFQNNSSRAFRPASDPHPAHSGYPEPGTCNGHSFDPCGAVPVGALWSFTFKTSGTWAYHDHMNPSQKGMVVVK